MSVLVPPSHLLTRSRTDDASSCSNRPLPDERPRQSVANLIGRFELQGKRQTSPAVPAVPRSSSVSSQIAGDAVKEEHKEKREWPPKPVVSADIKPPAPTLSASPSSSMAKPPVASPQPIPDPAPPAEIPTTPTPTSPEPAKSPPSKGKAVTAGKSTSAAGTRRAVASPQKSRSPNSSSTKSLVNSPPKASLQSSVSQPLRYQHTGQSVTSNPSTTRHTRSVPRTAPSTPSRPKSSASHHPAAARPKTPSSGLFAPTAASLARSRNALPPPPPPVKKMTLSSDAAERLSKPTAASLSKVRTPVTPAASPARMVKSTSTGVHASTPRGPSKLKAGRAPVVKSKEADTKEGEIKLRRASVSSEPPRSSEPPVADHIENGRESGAVTLSDIGSPEAVHGPSEAVSDVAHDPAPDAEVRPDPEVRPEQHAGESPVKDEALVHKPVVGPPPEIIREHEHLHVEAHAEAHEYPVPEPADPHPDKVVGNGDSIQVELTAPGNDIEDIVNLLEGTKPRPQSIVTIPDEHEEIPDEY